MNSHLSGLLLIIAGSFTSFTASASEVQLASVHAAIGDLSSGKLLHTKNADLTVPIASVTKLMTAMVVLDGGQPLNEPITILGWEKKTEKNAYSRIRVDSKSRGTSC